MRFITVGRLIAILALTLSASGCGDDVDEPAAPKEPVFTDAQKELLYLVDALPGEGPRVMTVHFEAAINEAFIAQDLTLEADGKGSFHLLTSKKYSEEEAVGGKDGREGIKTPGGFYTRRQGYDFVERSSMEMDWKRWWDGAVNAPKVVLDVLVPSAAVTKEAKASKTVFILDLDPSLNMAKVLDDKSAEAMEQKEPTWASWLGHQITWSTLSGKLTFYPEGEEQVVKGAVEGLGTVKKGLSSFQMAVKLKVEVVRAPSTLTIEAPEYSKPVGRPKLESMIEDVLKDLDKD